MRFLQIAMILVVLTALAIAAVWIWFCFNPGIIYCRNGVLYMSLKADALPVL